MRIVLLGRGGVGKSAITIQFCQHIFYPEYDPSIEDSYRKTAIVDNTQLIFDILDTAYLEYYSPMKEQYMHYAHAFIVVCDLTDRPTLVEVNSAVNDLVLAQDREVNDMPIVFALNKIDLLNDSDKKLATEEFSSEIRKIVNEFSLTNWKIMECSAKQRQNIDEIFMDLARRRQYYDIVDDFTLLQNITLENSQKKSISEHSRHKKCSLM
ncbi:ras family small GTPase [Naegleria gruberi]|uniref:Ras family small GTPase n=1 Tax=Naegleria gruberi TaxID=5762 RepID=D2W024_NAEGR|nr:ras family small GTPase [Naegleria gruberi]EFC37497.1 ras family small GTPase [Naegleria gruberi]|eukprot:XP_002670241.1 ras family small GTPase [Naegleria gruberi strain NEG-M]